MKRIISLFLCLVMMAFSAITVFGAEEEETIPIPERPQDIYVIDEADILTQRSYNNIVRKGNGLFALTGAQVVMLIVDEDNGVELGLLAQEVLERWEIGAYEKNNGVVFVVDFNRGRASYAVGEGLSEVLTQSVVTKLITDYTLGDAYAAGKYSTVASSLYNDIIDLLYTYYGASILDWDGETYFYEAEYEVEKTDNTLLYAGAGAAAGILFFVLIIVSSIRHNKKMDEITGREKQGGYSDEEDEAASDSATEEVREASDEAEDDNADDYVIAEGEYNTDEGEYNTDSGSEDYNTDGEWKYN